MFLLKSKYSNHLQLHACIEMVVTFIFIYKNNTLNNNYIFLVSL